MIKKYNTFRQRILCSKCNTEIKIVEKNITRTPVLQLISETCIECKNNIRKIRQNKMKTNNPMFNSEIRNKVSSTAKENWRNPEKIEKLLQGALNVIVLLDVANLI